MNTVISIFPYGTYPVDPNFSTRYIQEYSLARSYQLPNRLPHHHPLLARLEGVYPFQYTIPPWWYTQIAQVESDLLRHLLSTVSAQEFRAGCLNQARWKAFREALPDEERRNVPQSPKLAILLEGVDWSERFINRGPTDTPDHCRLVISTQPGDFFYMSNGREWRSCQHWRNGTENERLPGNFYDTGVAVAMVLPLHSRVEDNAAVLARTTLRVFHHDGCPVVAIGRTYHNNETLAILLLGRLAEILDTQSLSWGVMTDVNTLDYCETGAFGCALAQRLIAEEVFLESEPCWFPRGWCAPYVDGYKQWERDWEQEHDEYYRMRLSTRIRLMRPRTLPPMPEQTGYRLAQLSSVGLLSRFL
jgi:hypothetical protein